MAATILAHTTVTNRATGAAVPIDVAIVDGAGAQITSFGGSAATAATAALTNVPESATSVTLLASNASRLAFIIINDSDATLWAKCGTTASATSFTEAILPRGEWSTRSLGVNYTGRIDGIWESTPGTVGHTSARVTELSA